MNEAQRSRQLRQEATQINAHRMELADAKATEEKKQAQTNIEQKHLEAQERHDNLVKRLVAEEFEVITSLEFKPEATQTVVASPNVRKIIGAIQDEPLRLFFQLLPLDEWNHLATKTEEKTTLKRNSNQVNGRYRSFFKAVTPKEIVQLLEMR